MKIMVCGYARHGKDQFCEYMGIPFNSSSRVALDKVIWDAIGHGFADKDECYELRVNHRSTWYNLIKAYNTPDLTRLCRDIFEENDIYCGIRDREEFLAAKQQRLFDLSIWVDASGRVPPEDSSSCTLTPDDCDIVITNNGSLYDLEMKARRIAQTLTQQSSLRNMIVEWADEVFPERTVLNAIQKMVLEEIPEYLMDRGNPMELADLGILLYDIAHLDGVDLDSAIRKKMTINRFRTWGIDARTGLLKHNKSSDEDTARSERMNDGGAYEYEEDEPYCDHCGEEAGIGCPAHYADEPMPSVKCPWCSNLQQLDETDLDWARCHGYRERSCDKCSMCFHIKYISGVGHVTPVQSDDTYQCPSCPTNMPITHERRTWLRYRGFHDSICPTCEVGIHSYMKDDIVHIEVKK